MLRLLVVCRAAFLVLMSTGSFCVMESQQVTADDLQQQIAVTKSRLESLSESDPNFAILSSRLGSLLYSAGRFTGSTEALQRALDSDKQYRPSNLTDLVVDEVNLARACLQIGDLRKASQLLEDAMNQLTHMSPAPLDMSEPVYALQGSIFESKGDLDSALKAFKLAQDYDEQDHNLTEYANRLNDQARILERRNDFAKAAILLEKARTVLFDNGLKNSYVYPTVIADLGIAYSSLSQYSAAEPLLIEARQLLEGLYGTGSVQEAEVLNALGLLYDDLGRHREAEQLQRSVLTLRVAGYDSDATALAQNNLGKTLILVGKWSEAEELLRQAQQHFQRSSTPTATLMLADVETNLAELYIRERGINSYAEMIVGWTYLGFVLNQNTGPDRKQFPYFVETQRKHDEFIAASVAVGDPSNIVNATDTTFRPVWFMKNRNIRKKPKRIHAPHLRSN